MEEKYLIYKLKGQNIKAQIPKRLGGNSLVGYVKSVDRDILNNRILLTVDEQTFSFREPKHIQHDDKNVVFIYGDVTQHDMKDEELLEELRNGEHIDSILKNSVQDEIYTITFSITPKQIVEKTRKSKKNDK